MPDRVRHGSYQLTTSPRWGRASERADVLRLRALRTLGYVELDLLVLVEGLVALRLDGRVVNEDVVAAVLLGDEAEALLSVEPLNGALSHARISPCIGRETTTSAASAQVRVIRRPASQREETPLAHKLQLRCLPLELAPASPTLPRPAILSPSPGHRSGPVVRRFAVRSPTARPGGAARPCRSGRCIVGYR